MYSALILGCQIRSLQFYTHCNYNVPHVLTRSNTRKHPKTRSFGVRPTYARKTLQTFYNQFQFAIHGEKWLQLISHYRLGEEVSIKKYSTVWSKALDVHVSFPYEEIMFSVISNRHINEKVFFPSVFFSLCKVWLNKSRLMPI